VDGSQPPEGWLRIFRNSGSQVPDWWLKVCRNNHKLGLTNVTFHCTDAKDLDVDKKYDTIFSMRTMHENAKISNFDSHNWYKEAGLHCSKFLDDYAKVFSNLLFDEGHLITIERNGHDFPRAFGWVNSLEKNGFAIEEKTTAELKCKELGENVELFAFVANKNNDSYSNDSFKTFQNMLTHCTDFSNVEFWGWEAKIVFEFFKGKTITGFIATNKLEKHKYIITEDIRDESKIMALQLNDDRANLNVIDKTKKDEVLKATEEQHQIAESGDYEITDLV